MPRFVKSFVFALILILAAATASIGTETIHIVKSGDSLWSIARNNGVTVAYLKNLNSLKSDSLQIGDQIVIHQQAQVTQPITVAASTSCYIVKSGDSLWSIARSHNTTVAHLKEINGLNSDFLKLGQQLKIGTGTTYVASAITPSRSGESIDGDRIIELAANYLGTPYAYGGKSPSGFDCSGFTSYIYKQFGINLPHIASSQYGMGVAVERSDLRAGDLVFFTCSGSNIDHVGISCGSDRFIHSSSPRSGGVIYSSLQDGYYARCYAGARRIIR